MRMLKALSLGLVFLASFAPDATAQSWDGLGYFNVSFGGQAGDQTFTDTTTFSIYNERGAIAAGHSVGGGQLYDVSAGARVWKNLGIGIGYSALKNKNDATVTIRVPHPVVFGQSREASATVPGLERTENVVHLQLVWMLPLTSKFQLAVMGGPSFFTVRQDVASIRVPLQDISDPAPFNALSITSVTVTDIKDSPVGVNVGVDGTYLVTRMFGVGAFVRYAGATVDLPPAAGITRDQELKAGGTQAGIGLRVRF